MTPNAYDTIIFKERNPQKTVLISWGFNYETSNGANQPRRFLASAEFALLGFDQVQNDDKPRSKSLGINLNGGAFCDQNSNTNRAPPNKTTSPTLGSAWKPN